jgi:hypothetical protein
LKLLEEGIPVKEGMTLQLTHSQEELDEFAAIEEMKMEQELRK